MKHTILMVFVIGASILFFGCSENNFMTPELDQSDQVTTPLKSAIKPSPNLTGKMELTFMFVNPVWDGTIVFEGSGDEYGMRFIHLSPQKGFSQASPFEEYFEIYDLAHPDVVYLGGPDVGVTTLANKPPDPCKYRMNGEIDFAIEPFEMWLGRKVHMSGIITWQNLGTSDEPNLAPLNAPGTFRIN